jgi:23S rRNA pseudouridine2605 synthase
MDDDTKKPAKRGPKGSGPGNGGSKGPGGGRRDGERKPFVKRDGKPGEARAGGPKRDFKRDDRPAGGGDRKPYSRPDGEKRPFRKPDGDRPVKNRDDAVGEARAERPKRDFKRDDRPAGDGARKPYSKPDGEKRPFRKPDGDRPFVKREGKPAGGDRKPYSRPDGEKRPFRKPDGDRPFRKREDAAPAGGARPAPDFKRDDRPARPGDAPRPGRKEREAGEVAAAGGEERIARRLARVGVASRRDAEEMIVAGRVSVNGKVLESPALNVRAGDKILVDGQPIAEVERTRLFLFHKPSGVVTTNRDPEGRKTVFDILPPGLPRLMTIGRLDINTEGLLLLTNDGGLSRVLELPATGWLRRYRVRVHGKVEPEALEGLKDGIAVDGVFYGGIEATLDREQGSNAWLSIGLREGKNREVKNILGALGLEVTRLIRLSYGPFQLGELAEGEVRELKGKLLRDQLGERLIEESGANFDAPIITEFSNKPVKAEKPRAERAPARKMDRDERREDALGRLDTRAPRGKPDFKGKKPFDKDAKGGRPAGKFGGRPDGKSGGKFGDREERPADKPRSRTANVWMAPGARPMGEKKAAETAARSEGRRYAGKPRPMGGGKPGGDRGGAGGGPRGGPGSGPRKPRDKG